MWNRKGRPSPALFFCVGCGKPIDAAVVDALAMRAMNAITISAPAKVNTVLRVVGRRPNGYHDLEMVMVPLSVADEISLTKRDSGIELVCDGGSDEGMQAERNLAWRAARALQEAAGISSGVRIELTKRVPIAAGLGGGSSDAAAVLRGLNELWELGWEPQRLAEIGVHLGADVPFFCFGRSAWVGGIGDRIDPLEKFPNLSLLLVNPNISVATPWVYGQWDELQNQRKNKGLTGHEAGARVRPLFQGVSDVIESLHNDLEAVTIPAYPIIADIKRALQENGAAGTLMSGSGPTVFGLFRDRDQRDRAAQRIDGDAWRVIPADV